MWIVSALRILAVVREDQRANRWRSLAIALAVVALSLAACDARAKGPTMPTATPIIAATQTAAAQATHGAAAVWVDLAAQQEGDVAAPSGKLTIVLTVTNRTSASIHLYSMPCYALFDIQLRNARGQESGNLDDNTPCLLGDPPVDADPGIEPSDIHTWTVQVVAVNRGWLTPGSYTLVVQCQWHQGTLDQLRADPSGVGHGTTLGQAPIVLR